MEDITFEIDQAQLGKKAAIVIGINEYEQSKTNLIPVLGGAENDANELHDILIKYGRFQVLPNHKLIGRDANRRSILSAVSQLFRKPSAWDFILFYFSGHGMVDEYNDGYLAPWDTDPSDPFVSGINMEDLRKAIYMSKNSASVGIILDCCYAGIITEKKKGNNATIKNIFADNVGKLYKPPEGVIGSISGKFTLASSGADVQSREYDKCTHYNNDVPHSHGIFTYNLIEALNGRAAKRSDGIITFGDIKSDIMENMKDPEQIPFSGTDKDSYLSNIRIAIVPDKFKAQIDYHVSNFENMMKKDPEKQYIEFRRLHSAAIELRGLIAQNSNDPQIPVFTKLLNDELEKYNPLLLDWLNDMNNKENVGIKMNDLKEDLYDVTFYDLLDYLTFDKFNHIDALNLDFLYTLQVDIKQKTQYKSTDDPGLNRLVAKIKSALEAAGLKQNLQ